MVSVKKSSVPAKPAAVKKAAVKNVAAKKVVSKKTVPVKAPAKKAKPVAATKKVASAAVAPVIETPKEDLVRDGFTMPKAEYDLLGVLKTRLVALARPTKKGELLRAGVAVLAAMSDADLKRAVEKIPSLKTGRPKKSKSVASKLPKK